MFENKIYNDLPLWFIIQPDFLDHEEEFFKLLSDKCLNYACFTYEDLDLFKKIKTPNDFFANVKCCNVFPFGSIEYVKKIENIFNLNYCGPIWSCYDWSFYSKYFEKYLFNRNAFLETNLRRIIDKAEDIFGNFFDKMVFIKPFSGCKDTIIFTGDVFDLDRFKTYIKESNYSDDKHGDEKYIISDVKHIDYEWRTIVYKNQYLTGSQYRTYCHKTKRLGVDPSPDCPECVKSFVNHVMKCSGFDSENLFVLDIVESNGKQFVLEINALSTSGNYDCDNALTIDAIVDKYLYKSRFNLPNNSLKNTILFSGDINDRNQDLFS